MCIVADNVKNVSKTKIACFQTGYRLNNESVIHPGQLVVYSANVESTVNTNALILPVYNPGNDVNNIIPIDLSGYLNFFEDVENLFIDILGREPIAKASYYFNSLNKMSSPLEVHEVGDYKFSIVPHKNDFDKINRNVLNVVDEAKTSIMVHNDDYSFIVYQFKGSGDVSPFGYLSNRTENGQMIIPTIHGHDTSVNDIAIARHDTSVNDIALARHPDVSKVYDKINSNFIGQSQFEEMGDFDHKIFILARFEPPHKLVLSESNYKTADRILSKINSDYKKRNITIYLVNDASPMRKEFKGNYKNRNMIVGGKQSISFHRDLIHDMKFFTN